MTERVSFGGSQYQALLACSSMVATLQRREKGRTTSATFRLALLAAALVPVVRPVGAKESVDCLDDVLAAVFFAGAFAFAAVLLLLGMRNQNETMHDTCYES